MSYAKHVTELGWWTEHFTRQRNRSNRRLGNIWTSDELDRLPRISRALVLMDERWLQVSYIAIGREYGLSASTVKAEIRLAIRRAGAHLKQRRRSKRNKVSSADMETYFSHVHRLLTYDRVYEPTGDGYFYDVRGRHLESML